MKSDQVKFLLCLLFFTVLAAVAFRCTWPADHVFSASDMNIGRMALKKYTLPEQLTGFFGSSPVLGGTNYRYMLFNILVMLLPLSVAAKTIFGLILVAGSVSMVWFLRLWNRSWLASVFGALAAFWFNSVTLASAGHGYKMEVLVFSVLSLCFVEKSVRAASVRKSIGFSLLAGGAVGIMLIEQQDVALLAGLFVGAYALFRLICVHGRSVPRWLSVLIPVGAVALMLSGSMVFKSYQRNVAGAASVQSGGEEKWNFVTQWSMVPGEWPDLIAPGWSGWSTGNPEGPYWGKIGRSAGWERTRKGFQNFRLDSIYIGIIPFLLAGIGILWGWKNRKSEEGEQALFWMGIGVIGLWLACGKYSLLYKLFYQLPMVNSIRAPIKLLDNFQICLAVVAAFGLDVLLRAGAFSSEARKKSAVVFAAVGGGGLAASLWFAVFSQGRIDEFTVGGMGAHAELMTRNISTAWLHAGFLALIAAGLVFALWKKRENAKWAGVAFIAVLAVDSLMLTSHYFRAEDISALKKGNSAINFIKENQGDERTFLVDQGGIYNRWLAADGPYHQLNLFNVWQMSRMPVEYKNFLSIVGRNQIRLWELSAIKYIAAPAVTYQQITKNPQMMQLFEPVLRYQVPTSQGMRSDVLLEFKSAIPRFSIFEGWTIVPEEQQCKTLASPEHPVHSTLLLTPGCGLEPQGATDGFKPLAAQTTKKNAVLSVKAERPSIVRFAQRYQPEWRVYVDGEKVPLLKVDYLCMGVYVPPGEHEIEFKCMNGMPQAVFALCAIVFSVLGAVVLIRAGGENP